ncbi:MAG: PAS domain-containing protein [Planctomycetes bacterium]|nr:PAS domain-containing protein [Planctomycetota bacterium]
MSSTVLPAFPEPGSTEYAGVLYAYSHLTTPVALLDADGTLLFLNQAALDFFKVGSIREIVGPTTDDWHGRLQQVESPSVAGPGQEEEMYYRDKETGRVYYRESIRLPKKDGGSVRLETLHDITALYEGDERVKRMIDAAPLCCNYWNSKLENIDCNLEAAKLFDLPDKKAYLDRFQELSPELQPNGRKSADEARRHITNAFRDGYDRPVRMDAPKIERRPDPG